MAKANKKSIKKDETINKPVEFQKEHTIYDDFPARTLSQEDADHMKEIFTLSNNVAALIRDYAEKQIAVKHMKNMAKKIRDEKQPLMVKVASNMYKTELDYNTVSKDIEKQADELEKSLVLIHGQIEHRYEDYVSTLIRHKRFVEKIINVATNIKITGHRSDEVTRAEEEKLFDSEFEKELQKEPSPVEKESK